jgi:NADH-quinone oxidoreductase subunit C
MLDKIQNLLSDQGFHSLDVLENTHPEGFRLHADELIGVCECLHSHPETYFDHLSCLAAVDYGPEENRMDVSYVLYSIPYGLQLTLQVAVDREQPVVPSRSAIWRGANWHEREAYDLYGVEFTHHPDLRRILMPADWVGHPLRKDYQEAGQ